MDTALLVPILVGGGIAYAYKESLGEESMPVPYPYPQTVAPSGSTIQQALKPPVVTTTATWGKAAQVAAFGFALQPRAVTSGWGYTSIDPELQKKLDEVEAYAEKTYNDMNEVAKGAAAEKLNAELKLDPPLTGHESWKDVARVVGAAAGTAAGTAICGPICGVAGAYAGAYLGGELADYIGENYEAVKKKLENAYGSVKGGLEDAYDYVAGLNPF